MIYKYPPEVHEFVKEWCTKLRDPELAAKCNAELGTNFTTTAMKSFRGNHGYLSGLPKKYSGEEYWKYQTRWPQGMYEFIRDNSWNVSSKEMADMVNEKFGTDYTPGMIKQFRQRHGIKSGRTGWYQRGHAPGTKGKTLEEICKHDPEKLARVKSTQFKKGQTSWNHVPIGTISKNKEGYLVKKVSEEGGQWDRWKSLHRLVWEEHNGPIPAGMSIIFKDGDRTNCDIDNLMMVSQAENRVLTRKQLRFEDSELTEAGVHMVRLLIKANKMKRGG